MTDQSLSDFQKECIELFVNAATALSVPRSVGELYGLLFSTEDPLCLDDLTSMLMISRGSAHEGIKWLRAIGAVNPTYIPGKRKEFFVAETSLRKLATGYLRDKIEPHIENGRSRLEKLREASKSDESLKEFQRARANQVMNWYKFIQNTLPIVNSLAGKY
jgi:DNA-binding transcriptional regulator GbsR (MarR family)